MKSFLTFVLGPMRTYLGVLAFLLTMSAAAPAAFAWGDAGHRIVCKIAYLELKPTARKQVDALIALDPKFRSFAASCVWPDLFPPVRPAEHFINVPREANSIDPKRLCPTADRCVASAILNDSRDLAISTNSQDRLRLLKSLGHWVGDIHQPFHVSFEDDKGGTLVTASGHCTANLHLAWDFALSNKSSAPMRTRQPASSKRKSPKPSETNGFMRLSMPQPSRPGRMNPFPSPDSLRFSIASSMIAPAGIRPISLNSPAISARSIFRIDTLRSTRPSCATG